MDMRRLIRLVENHQLEYMHGNCHVFALAVQSLTQWPMMALLYRGRKRGETSLANCHDVVHVYALTPDHLRFDVLGLGESPAEYQAERANDLDQQLATVPCTRAFIDKMVSAGWLSQYSPAEIAAAIPLAQAALEQDELI